jgi:alkylation response protein AidB-like acyl-CoA dehydrogenase
MTFEYEPLLESIAVNAAQRAASVDRGAFPIETLHELGDAGLLGLISAVEVGGKGLGLPAAAAVVERLARECGSTAMVVCMHFCAAAVIEAFGPAEIRRAIASGKHLTTLALSEAGSRSQFWVPLSTATPDGSLVKLNARKSFATTGTTTGVRVPPAGFDGLGLRGNDSSPIIAEDARIPATARLGEDGGGFAIMMGTVLPWFNVLAAAVSVGLMEAATQRTCSHATGSQFVHAGSTIADLPTIRAYIARMRIKTDQAQTLLADTLAAITAGRANATLRVLESKAAAGEAAAEVTDIAMRVCGGAAFRKEVGVERIFRDARAATVMGPTTDVLFDFIGKAACGLPLF